jgi:uncharacterized membrane protein
LITTLALSQRLRLCVATLAFSIALLAAWAPVIQTVAGAPSGESIYSAFSRICHQYPSRSLWIADRPMALCIRCWGGYLGIALGGAFASRMRGLSVPIQVATGVVLFAAAMVEPALQIYRQATSPGAVRFAAGLVGGLGLVLAAFPVPRLITRGGI